MSADAAALPDESTAPRLSTPACLGWGVGPPCMSLMFNASGVLTLRFLVDYVGIAAAVAAPTCSGAGCSPQCRS